MKKKKKSNNKLLILVFLIIIVGLGITYAWFSWRSDNNSRTSVTITTGEAEMTYEAGPDITNIKLIPVSSKEKGETDGTGVAKNISVSATENVYLDLNMTLEIFPNALKHESLVWEIYKGNILVNKGNLGNSNQGDVINLFSDELISTNTSNYKLYIWIDGNQENAIEMMNQHFKFVLNANATDNPEILPNAPKLADGMIPVKYDGSKWVKADSSNANNDWYDYSEKKWANVVLVSNTNRSSYVNANVGTEIPENDVLAYYVWIPRYKYKVFNINKVIGTDSYNAQTTGIDIVFEAGKQSTGTVRCNYDFSVTATASVRNETCSGSNGDYYTHPAFTFGNDEVTGFWMGKFEISSENPSASYGGGKVTNLTVRVKPNTISWRYNTVTNFWKVIYDMQKENNIYGLNTSKTNTDSHMLKNMEWGAVVYLTNSKYGRCTNNTCTEVTINSNTTYRTGGNAYVTNINQSTTGNIYGVYDMSGGAAEYVMGNMSSKNGSYAYYTSSGGSNYTYSGNQKYIDTYSYGTSYNNQLAYNRARLGDATSESKSWYSDTAVFVYSANSWFTRGGYYSITAYAGPFNFTYNNGPADSYYSSRAALLSLSSN